MQNRLYIGDNLTVMEQLLKDNTKVDCILTDPPYLTKNDKLTYFDRFTEEEWIEFMKQRFTLAHKLLKDTGCLIVNIDDRMHIELQQLLYDIFGKKNKVLTFIWKKRSSGANQSKFACIEHEYIICMAKNIKKFKMNGIPQFQQKSDLTKTGVKYNESEDEVGEHGKILFTDTNLMIRDNDSAKYPLYANTPEITYQLQLKVNEYRPNQHYPLHVDEVDTNTSPHNKQHYKYQDGYGKHGLCHFHIDSGKQLLPAINQKNPVHSNGQRISLTPFPGSIEIIPMTDTIHTIQKQIEEKYMHKIYCITNIKNNKSYVGYTSKTLDERLSKHIKSAMKDKSQFAIHCAIRKYKPDNFIIQELECYENEQEALGEEQFWIEYLETMAPNGYNMVEGGGLPPNQSNYPDSHKGRILSEESRKKISDALTGKRIDNGNPNKYAYQKKNGKWQARVRLGTKNVSLGCYDTPEEASEVAKNAIENYDKEVASCKGCWRAIPKTCQKLIDADMLVVKKSKKDGKYKIYQKQYANFQFNKKTGKLEPFVRTNPIRSIILEPTNLRSNKEIKEIFGTSAFTYAKPVDLIKKLLFVCTNTNDIVLDPFAGSGTTGQACWETNRQFILIQLDEGGIPELTKKRLDMKVGQDNYKIMR